MTGDIVFGTDILQDDAAKLTKLYLRVKSGTFSNDEYRHTNIYCTVSDAEMIDFIARTEGNKRAAIAVLLCAGLSKLYPKIRDFPIPLFDIGQVFGRVVLIDGIDWVLEDVIDLKISDFKYKKLNITKYGIYMPEELWGMIYRVSLDFKLSFTSILLYLMRTGVAEYNEFVNRFSRGSTQVPCEYLEYAKRSEKMFMQTLDVRYNDLFNRLKYLYSTYSAVLDDGHEDLKGIMKSIIDKSNKTSATG